ncbi:MAG: tRNA (adenosine(37)-N6)-threonylcarbamoyltransferase complex transferase subunit TsaD [Caldiserica bacterium]|nr:MAG: tRNA (adenosine(37)-N6)-threonylcarbamoyltransferase complex transferase subunit TsaD [Caldisericota bacterium]
MLVLGIETSCDETGIALMKDGDILSNVVESQIPVHKKFGGVIPEVASRKHVEVINHVLEEVINQSGVEINKIDIIGVTKGPGLPSSLYVGVVFAKTLGMLLNKKVVGVNHIEAHIYANFISHPELSPPFISLVASGGHCELVYFKNHGDYLLMGRTRDDAPGEAFDKVARILGLSYPGGPEIERCAKNGDPKRFSFTIPKFKDEKELDFSFSGIKTAVLYLVKDKKISEQERNDICASFQDAITRTLLGNVLKAVEVSGTKKVTLSGGVIANSYLRSMFEIECEKRGIKLFYPSKTLCTDNGVMVCKKLFYLNEKDFEDFEVSPDLKLTERSFFSKI